MGTGASKSRRLERFERKDATNQLLYAEEQSRVESLHQEEMYKLKSNINELREEIQHKDKCLRVKTEELVNEQEKNVALMFSELPLHLLTDKSTKQSYMDLCKIYELVTIAQCGIVGFGVLSSNLKPHEAVSLIDHVQAIIDEAFKDKDIFIMERCTDGCIVASGLVTQSNKGDITYSDRNYTMTPSSLLSDVSELATNSTLNTKATVSQVSGDQVTKTYSYYASLVAIGALKLMSLSTTVKIPQHNDHQLQLRIGINSGCCSAGVVSLQTLAGAIHVPHYKLFGPVVNMTKRLTSTSLALQIRVSKSCWELLTEYGGFIFERCPDFITCNAQVPVESYWLVGHENYNFALPSIDQAVSLSSYDDI